MDGTSNKHQWQTPVLLDISRLRLTASGVNTAATERYCPTAVSDQSDGYSPNYAPTTSGGPITITCTPK